ncbi:MAG: DUF192 domain-containing protein [Nitrospirota bacterium]|jgi:hypothetical protein
MKKTVAALSGILLVVFVIAALTMFGTDNRKTPPKVSIETQSSEVTFNVEIAADPEARARGLMFKKRLDSGDGMLFVFPRELSIPFWMKNTFISLDIIFADSEGRIVDVKTMEPCTEDPCPDYHSHAPFKYALEINAGLANALGIRPGALMAVDLGVAQDSPRPGPKP